MTHRREMWAVGLNIMLYVFALALQVKMISHRDEWMHDHEEFSLYYWISNTCVWLGMVLGVILWAKHHPKPSYRPRKPPRSRPTGAA